ncbi:DNA integrity scanning protein DisA nucleotide-binding domain protein [Williamsia sp. D3]|uniref:DNA integrity scanning protein DisA nucleotide-binding domain protein n=1 Tax=Williamsia TaxID=85043 RepID=UPI0009DD36B3|nr:DNA integrity scanning protein DisA nucleotide-binding domain protein [Williamsia sp. D3]
MDEVKQQRRRARLISELRDEDVALIEPSTICDPPYPGAPLPRGWIRPDQVGQLTDALIDELLHAIYPPVHERRTPSYGAIIFAVDVEKPRLSGHTKLQLFEPQSSSDSRFENPNTLTDPDAGSPSAEMRELANGVSTFVVRTMAGHGLAHVNTSNELDLITLCVENGCWVVQRHPSGVIKIFGRERLYLWENMVWRSRTYAHTRWMHLMHTTGTRDEYVGGWLLDFCLHVLSARHIGATLVWLPREPTDGLDAHLGKPARRTGIALSAEEPARREALATLLASVDGAAIVNRDGTVRGVEAFLKHSDDAEKFVHSNRGTRHNSAARFSYDVPESIVFVVSEDGPVTVFSDGADLLRLDTTEPTVSTSQLFRTDPVSVERVQCPQCQKPLITETIAASDLVDADLCAGPVDCPVCGHPGIAPTGADEGVAVVVRVAKPWESPDATVSWMVGLWKPPLQ